MGWDRHKLLWHGMGWDKKICPMDKPDVTKDIARKKMSLFGSTYICEQLFTKMKYTKSKTRSRLTDCHLENSLRVAASSIAPKIDT